MYPVQKDGTGNNFIVVTNQDNDLVRITLVPSGWTGGPCLRLQVQDEGGHLYPGPEFPVPRLGELMLAATKLILESEA